jgi:hypothetical protein
MKKVFLVLAVLALGSVQIALPVKVGQPSVEARCGQYDRVGDERAYLVIGFGVANACGGGDDEPGRGPGSPQSPIPDPRPGGIAY